MLERRNAPGKGEEAGMWFPRSDGRIGLEHGIPVVQIYSGQIKTVRVFVPKKKCLILRPPGCESLEEDYVQSFPH